MTAPHHYKGRDRGPLSFMDHQVGAGTGGVPTPVGANRLSRGGAGWREDCFYIFLLEQ